MSLSIVICASCLVSLNAQCSVTASSNSPVCVQDVLMLTATGSGSSWMWSGPNGFMSSDQNPIIDPAIFANNGTYNLTATDMSGCTATSSVDVIVNRNPQVTNGPYMPVCTNDPPISLIGTPLGGVWTGSGSGIIGNTFDPSVSGPGIHNVTYSFTDGNNCTNAVQEQIIVNPIATILEHPQNTSVCYDTDAIFEITVLEPNVSLQWQVNTGSGVFNNIPGENGPQLILSDVSMDMNNYQYRVIVILDNTPDPDCMIISDVATLKVHSGGALTCDDLVHISVNVDCSVDVDLNAGYFLQGHEYFDHYFVDITDLEGNPIDYMNGENLSQYIDQVLGYSVTDECSGNWCWGNVVFEDYFEPEISCNCPVGGEDLDGDGTIDGYAEECTLTCYEYPLFRENYWDNLLDELIPTDVEDFIENNIQDNCSSYSEDDVSFYDSYEDLGCDGALLRRTWTLRYNQNNGTPSTISCTQEYFFAPILISTIDTARIDPLTGLGIVAEDSIILPVTRIELDCGADISPAGIAAFFDNPLSEDQDTDDNNIDPDEGDIDWVIENNEGVPYAYPHFYVKGRNPFGPHPQPIEQKVCNYIVAYNDLEVEACAPGCGSNRKIVRTWTILDWCNEEFIQYDQVIKAVDLNPPLIEVPDITASVDPWSCDADVLLPHPEHLIDDCDEDLTYWIGFVEGNLTVTGNAVDGFVIHDALEGESVTVEYIAEDCCGNQGKTTMEVVVVDKTPPIAVTKELIVLSLANTGSPDEDQGIAKLFAIDVDNVSYDGCSDVIVEIRRPELHCLHLNTDTLYKDHVKFCCEDLDGQAFVEIDVQFRVTDESGNSNYAWSTIRLEDKSIPTVDCPADITLTCDMDYNNFSITGLPEGFAACGLYDLMCDENEIIEDTRPRRKGPNDGFFDDPRYDGVTIPEYNASCGYGALRRVFGSCASCVQWIIIEPIDSFNAATIRWPEDMVVDCDEYETGEPEWEQSLCTLVGASLTADTFYLQDGTCRKILNHWSVINWCEYDPTLPDNNGRYEHTQVIKLLDTQDPVVTVADSISLLVTDNCFSKGLEMSASATDEGECGSDWLKWELDIDLHSNWTSDYHYDSYGPATINGEPNPFYIAPTGTDEIATIVLPDGLPADKVWHRAVWKVSDGCGNITTEIRYFQIVDGKAPTPYCLNLSTAVMSGSGTVELWAIDFNVGSFDNCTDQDQLYFTFTDIAPPPRNDSEYLSSSDLMWYDGSFWYFDPEDGDYQDQDDYFELEAHKWDPALRSSGKIFSIDEVGPGDMLQIPIYVWDECGNKDFCIVNLRVIDNNGAGEGRIAGKVITENGQRVAEADIELLGSSPEFPINTISDEDGEYAFLSIPLYTDYTIKARKDGAYLNGVSTLDLLLIQKHILGSEILDSPYKMIAADANKDRSISAIDLIELRKLILGIYDELPDNVSWQAIDASQPLTIDNPWIFRDYISVIDLTTDLADEDFITVKIGDVNDSAQLMSGNEDEESKKSIALTYENIEFLEGEIVEMDLVVEDFENIYGLQFTLLFDDLTLLDVKGQGIDRSNYAIHGNALTLSYGDVQAEIPNEAIKLTFKANTAGHMSDKVRVSSKITKAEAYVGKDLSVLKIDLHNESDNTAEFKLYQNQPNPFKEYTVIGFDLPQDDAVSLSLYDITGKLIKIIETKATKGYNEIQIQKSDLEVNGLVHYKLKTSTHSSSKHMIVIE